MNSIRRKKRMYLAHTFELGLSIADPGFFNEARDSPLLWDLIEETEDIARTCLALLGFGLPESLAPWEIGLGLGPGRLEEYGVRYSKSARLPRQLSASLETTILMSFARGLWRTLERFYEMRLQVPCAPWKSSARETQFAAVPCLNQNRNFAQNKQAD